VEIRKVGVVGLGTMGAGIAQVSVQSGYETIGREVEPELGSAGARRSSAISPVVSKRAACPGTNSTQRSDA